MAWVLAPVAILLVITQLGGEQQFKPWKGGMEIITEPEEPSADSPKTAPKTSPEAGAKLPDDPLSRFVEQGYSQWEAQLLAQGWQQFSYEYTEWVPSALDRRAEQLAIARDNVILSDAHGRSSIDIDVRFRSFVDVLRYLPRAIQIGYLSPFPNQWLPSADAPTNRQVERVLAGAEIAIIYAIGLPALLLATWHWRREPLIWIVLASTGIYILVYALAFPVVGALMRYRFPAFALLFGMAAVYLLNRLAMARR
jgi:hypothetical protein